MTRRFVVGVDGLSEAQEASLRNYFLGIGSWWHWIPNFWMVVVRDDAIDPAAIRNRLTQLTSATRNNLIVIEVSGPHTWAGFGPNTKPSDMFEWINGTWTKGL